MKNSIILLVLFLLFNRENLYAQITTSTPLILRDIESPIDSVASISKLLFVPRLRYPIKLKKEKEEYAFIENPSVRYAIQQLKSVKHQDKNLKDAISILIQYTENEKLKEEVSTIRGYVDNTKNNIKALSIIKKEIKKDSLNYLKDIENFSATDSVIYYNSDLHTIVSYIENDSNFMWLRKISTDSVEIELFNVGEQSIKFWINNGRSEYHRFWALNNGGDSIGTWVQVIPRGKMLRLHMDSDVYQEKSLDSRKTKEELIGNKVREDYYNINRVDLGELNKKYWSYYGTSVLAFGQGCVANWSGGGENSLSLTTDLAFIANYTKNKTIWQNSFSYRLGFLKSGENEFRKNEEKLKIITTYGYQAFKNWYYSGTLDIETIIFNSYRYKDEERFLIGNFLSPSYYTLSGGLTYKKDKNFEMSISPAAGKLTWVRDTNNIEDPTRYGVDKGKKVRCDLGAKLTVNSTNKVIDAVTMTNALQIYSSYGYKEQRFVMDWQVKFNCLINYYMQTVVYANVVYNQSYSKKLQLKETLNIAINFRF